MNRTSTQFGPGVATSHPARALRIRPSSILLVLLYVLAVGGDLAIVAQITWVQNAFYTATFLALAFCVAYLWQHYGLRYPAAAIRSNGWLLLFLLTLVVVQIFFHQLDAGTYLRVGAYVGAALMAYFLLPAIILPQQHLIGTLMRVVAVASAVLSLLSLVSQFGVDSIAGLTIAAKKSDAYTIFGIVATGGILEHPIRLGTQALLGVAASLYLLHRRRSLLNFSLLGLCATGVLISVSRAAWLAAVVASLFVINRRGHRASRLWISLRKTLLAGAFLFSIYELATRWSVLGQVLRLDYGLSNRELTWPFALTMIAVQPLIGYGFLSSEAVKLTYGAGILPKIATDAGFENNFIDMAISSGVIAAGLYVLIFLVPIYRILKSRIEAGTRRVLMFTAIAALISVNFTNYNIGGLRSTSLAFSIFLGLANLTLPRVALASHGIHTAR